MAKLFPPRMLQRRQSGDQDTFVRLIGNRPAMTLLETWLSAELANHAGVRRSHLVDRLAERWFRDELAAGASNVDAALWAPPIIRRETEALLRELEGDFIYTGRA